MYNENNIFKNTFKWGVLFLYLFEEDKGISHKFYRSKEWKKTREIFLKSKCYICNRCGNYANVCHHIKHLDDTTINNPKFSLNFDNLEALCFDCHNKEHHRTSKNNKEYFFTAEGELILKNTPPPISN